MSIKGMKKESVREMARNDFIAARDSRRQIEQAKVRALQAYTMYRDDVPGGGKDGSTPHGPFGWSKITVPIIAWVVETALPRIGVQPPTVTVNAKNPGAVPYAEAKQLRIQADLKAAHSDEEMLHILKSMCLYGDGIAKTPWDPIRNAPSIQAVSWFDWWVSSEADRWHQAEVMFHRTWHTKRDLERLRDRKGVNGRRLYDSDAIDTLIATLGKRTATDSYYQERRDAEGLAELRYSFNDIGVVQVIECWYKDGARVVVGGPESAPALLRVVNEDDYPFWCPDGRPYRPFSVFQNTPNMDIPYSIGYGELLENHQQEATLLRNQNLDQASGNIFAPIGYDARKVRPEEITQAWSSPGGLFGTDGPPGDAVMRFSPGSSSRDFAENYEVIRNEAQMVAGISDLSVGIASANGMDASTATGASLIVGESNKRFQMLIKHVELGMRRVAENFDWMDRNLGGGTKYMQPESGMTISEYSQGITDENGLIAVGDEANSEDLRYEITVDAGAMAPPAGQEQAKRVMALVSALSAMPPPVQQSIDWPQLMRIVIEAHGFQPDRVLAAQEPMPPQGMPMPPMGQMPSMPGGPGPMAPADAQNGMPVGYG